MNLKRERARIAECFVRAALAEMDRVAVSIGVAAPVLPSNVVAGGLRRKADAVVSGMPDATVRRLAGASDDVLEAAFADIAKGPASEVLS